MSTSLLHHAFGIAGFHCTSKEYESGQVVFHIKPGDHPLRCPCCNSTNVILRGQKQRCFRAGWDMIKDIQKRHLLKHYAKPKLKHLRFLAIDEIAVAKGHCYVTVVMNLESGAVVFVGDGKGGDALKPFFKRLRHSGANIEAVAIDMSTAYIRAVKRHLQYATSVCQYIWCLSHRIIGEL